jgi:hypothetical protein
MPNDPESFLDPEPYRPGPFEEWKHPLATAPDVEGLLALLEQAPFMLEDPFLHTVERWIVQAEALHGWDLAEGLRERLAVLCEIRTWRDRTAAQN